LSVSDRLAALTPEQRALFELLREKRKQAAAQPAGLAPPPPVPRLSGPSGEGDWPLSLDQERLWFMHQLDPENTALNIDAASRMRGPLHLPAIRGAFDEIVRRHGAWRTTFTAVDGRPVQRVAARREQEVSLADLSALPAARREAEGMRLLAEGTRALFDLERGPLVRIVLLRLAAEDHLCLLTVHHLAIDWISFQIVWSELSALYDACLEGRLSPLPEPPLHFSDYAVWQRDWLRGEVLAGLVGHWRERLAGFPLVLELPTDRPRPAVQRMHGGRSPVDTGRALADGLRALARREGVTLFMIVLALFDALLQRFSGQEKIILGSNNANRNRPELEGVLGYFLTQVPFAVDLSGTPGFRELLARVRRAALDAYVHQDLPIGRLVEAVQPERSTSRPPLIQSVVLVLDGQYNKSRLTDLAAQPVGVYDGNARYDLMLGVYDYEDTIEGAIEYDADLFDETTLRRLIELFLEMGKAVVADPDLPLSRLPVLSAAARHQALVEWNDTARPAVAWTVPSHLAERAARDPQAPALFFGGEVLSHGDLDRRATALAARLRARGAGRESRVALLLERSPELVVALLAVWKAGAAAVPLDPSAPPERTAALLADAAPVLVIRPGDFDLGSSPLGGGGLEQGGGQEGGGPEPSDLAYLIYTSGTTGVPKAVLVEHGSLAATLSALVEHFGFNAEDRMPHLARFSFDIALFELLAPLLAGGACELLTNDEVLEPAALLAAVERATRVHAVPSLVRQIAAGARERGSDAFTGLRTVFTGGDLVPPELTGELLEVFPQSEVAVLYGPTEATIVCTAWTVPRGERPNRSLIGRPLAGVTALVMDGRGAPVPLGVPGELWIGGPGVARGYHRRPEITQSFTERGGQRFYRTGDLVRQVVAEGGALEFLGRTDDQVKIRGFRVEPGEVEAALAAHPAVREAVVVARAEGGGEKRLVAYWVPSGVVPATAALREHLAARLPGYMVPAALVLLPELPLTAHGKVDRAKLPAPEPGDEGGEKGDAPRTPVEELVGGVFCEVLGLPRVTRTADFFELGGHSLLATQVASRLRAAAGIEVPVLAVFQAPTVAALAAFIEAGIAQGAGATAPPLVAVPRGDGTFPLSFAQERLWFLDRLRPGTAAYNIPLALAARGAAQPEALAAALAEMVRRHETLRTTFATRDGRAVQFIRPIGRIRPIRPITPAPISTAWPLPLVDLAALPADLRNAEAQRLAGEEAARPFDLERGPVLRTTLLRLAGDEHALLLTLHHIAGDGWSLGVVVTEIAALYRAAVEGLPSPLSPLPVQYADFAVWQRAWLQGETLERQLGYWRERLAGAPMLDLPTDRPRPPAPSFRGATLEHAVSPETAAGLAALARRHDATLFMVLLAAAQTLLGRYAGQEDIVVGSPIANRTRAELEPLIGFFVNTLALRGDLSGDPRFAELVAGARRSALGAYAHQDLPFERVVEELRPERRRAHNPLFQVMFGVQNAPLGAAELPGLTFAPIDFELPVTRFDLELFFAETGDGGLAAQLTYSTDLFDAATILRLADHLDNLLAAVLADPSRRLSAIPLLGAAERHQLTAEWSDAAVDLPDADVFSLFAEQARRRPEAVAVSSEEGDLTYAELHRRALGLARRLAASGVGPEVRVALVTERSPAMVAGMLGILAAGGAYVPLDPTYPAERLAWMLADSGARVLLGQPALLAGLPEGLEGAAVVELTADPAELESPGFEPVFPLPDGLAYVMYTSGSTGRPKGVGITHRNIVRLVRGNGFADLGPEQIFLQLAPISFDASTLEIWAPLLNGGRLAVLPPRAPSLAELGEAVERWGVTSLWLTAGLFQQVVDDRPEALRPLRQLFAGGDVLSPPHVRRALAVAPGLTLIDGYGPTEGTTFTCCHAMTDPAQVDSPVPIGRPIAGTRVRVLDAELRPVPAGVPGELWAGGEGIARGYLGRPDLTAERFLPDPFAAAPGERLYRTGDVARFRADGRLDFLGRRDGQIKLRGFRIELGEVESALARHPAVRAAVVTARDDGGAAGRRLVAYAVAPDLADATELRRFLAAALPEHMVPSSFVLLDALPLTANGKVDRAALPAPDSPGLPAAAHVPPATPLEELLAHTSAELLGVEGMGMGDNFFERGGHSLLATQLVSRLTQEHGIDMTLQMVFDAATLGELADRIVERELAGADDEVLAEMLRAMEGA
jgi:amino acid adenylation domain-containing protein